MSFDSTPTAFVRARKEVAMLVPNMTTLDEVPLVTSRRAGYGDDDHDDARAALSSIVKQYPAPVDAMAVDAASDAVAHVPDQNVVDEPVSVADTDGIYELPEMSAPPFADTTVSSAVEQFSAPISETTNDAVVDAEEDIPSGLADPAKKELIITPTLTETAPETYEESTVKQVHRFTSAGDNRDMKLPEHVRGSATSRDGPHTAFGGDGNKQVAALEGGTAAFQETPRFVEYIQTGVCTSPGSRSDRGCYNDPASGVADAATTITVPAAAAAAAAAPPPSTTPPLLLMLLARGYN
ncbi:hypothetical protein V1519DRAFT_476090 [Lipomyces tetrasporus]